MRKPSPDWVNILFLCLTPVVGFGGTAWYAATHGIVWWEPVLALALFMAIGIGIGSGVGVGIAIAFLGNGLVGPLWLVLTALILPFMAPMPGRDEGRVDR